MSPAITLLLASLALFEVKHFLCDFVLQTAYLYRHKGIYGHPAGFIHAGLHALNSLPAMLLIGSAPGPLRRTIPMPPSPGGVAIAAMVSS